MQQHQTLLIRPTRPLSISLERQLMELKGFLLSYGFVNSHSGTSLFIYHTPSVTLYLLVYMDDLIVIGNDTNFPNCFLHALAHRFSIKDLGDLHYFLSIKVISTKSGLL